MPGKDFETELKELRETRFFDYIPRIIKVSFPHQANTATLRIILKGKKFVVLAIPLLFYLSLSMWLLWSFGYFHRRLTIIEVFFILFLWVFLAWLASTVIKKAICHWMDRIITLPEKDYQQDIEGFLKSIEPILGKTKALELPAIFKDFLHSKTKNTISIAELFTKRLIPENICLALIDQSQERFLVRASMGLKQDSISKVTFSPDSRLIFWLKKLSKDLNKERFSEMLPKDRDRKIRSEDIKKIKEEMNSIKAEACSQIYYSTVFVGFLSLGKKLIGKYTQDELAVLPYLTKELGQAMVDTSFNIVQQERNTLKSAEMFLNEMVIEEAKRIVSGEDEKIWETRPIKAWYRFEKEIHQGGLTPETQDLMKKDYGLDIPIGFELNLVEHSRRVRLSVLAMVKELGLKNEALPTNPNEHLNWLKHQTEWYDGSGYPDGMAGEEIPLLARLTSIAEALDIFYQCWKNVNQALNVIATFSGTKFDPEIAKTLKSVCEKGKILNNELNYPTL